MNSYRKPQQIESSRILKRIMHNIAIMRMQIDFNLIIRVFTLLGLLYFVSLHFNRFYFNHCLCRTFTFDQISHKWKKQQFLSLLPFFFFRIYVTVTRFANAFFTIIIANRACDPPTNDKIEYNCQSAVVSISQCIDHDLNVVMRI